MGGIAGSAGDIEVPGPGPVAPGEGAPGVTGDPGGVLLEGALVDTLASMLCSKLCISVICCESFPTRACTSCRLSCRPCVVCVTELMLDPVLACTSWTTFCSAPICTLSWLTPSSDCCTSVFSVALLVSTTLRRSCC